MLRVERKFQNLKVWGAAHALTLRVYRLTAGFPGEERYGLVAQLRHASASIAANLAEGSGRTSPAAFASFVDVAYASAAELEYHLLLARDLTYLDESVHSELKREVAAIQKMTAALRWTLRRARNEKAVR